MSPYLFTLLTNYASLVLFVPGGMAIAAVLVRRGRWAPAAVLIGAVGLVAAGLLPPVVHLVVGDPLPNALPGLDLASTVPWWLLTAIVLLRPAAGRYNGPIDAVSLVGLGLALQGIAGFALGLGLVARRWLSPDTDRGLVMGGVAALVFALLIGTAPELARPVVGQALGLGLDGQVRLVGVIQGVAEAWGWLAIASAVTLSHRSPSR